MKRQINDDNLQRTRSVSIVRKLIPVHGRPAIALVFGFTLMCIYIVNRKQWIPRILFASRHGLYRTLRDNCTTEWIPAVDKLSGRIWGVQLDTVLNGGMGRLLHRTGAMDTNLPYREAREQFRIDQRIVEHLDDPDFSNVIRLR